MLIAAFFHDKTKSGGVGCSVASPETESGFCWLQFCITGHCKKKLAEQNVAGTGKGFGATPRDMSERNACPGNA